MERLHLKEFILTVRLCLVNNNGGFKACYFNLIEWSGFTLNQL